MSNIGASKGLKKHSKPSASEKSLPKQGARKEKSPSKQDKQSVKVAPASEKLQVPGQGAPKIEKTPTRERSAEVKVASGEKFPFRASSSQSPLKEAPPPAPVLRISRVQVSSEKNYDVLEKCKEFLNHDNRQKLARLCEIEDISKNKFIPLMTFGRVLRYIGFRLLFDEIRHFVLQMNFYSETTDKVFYLKLTSTVLRKLFRPKPYQVIQKPSQNAAATLIQKYYLSKKNSWVRPGVRNPGVVLKELAKKLNECNKPLLRCFEEAERNRCGFIETSDFDIMLRNHKVECNYEEVKETFNFLDTRKAGKVNYNNFITGIEGYFYSFGKPVIRGDIKKKLLEITKTLKGIFKETGIPCEVMFKVFDKDNRGVISFDNFSFILYKIGAKYSQTEMRQVFETADVGKDGYLSFIEFATVFYDLNESPVDILNRLEMEEKIRKELEAKRLEEEEKRLKEEEEEKKKKDEEDAIKKALEEEEKKKKGEAGGKAGKGKGGKAGKGKAAKTGGEKKAGGKKGKEGKEGKAKTGKKGGKKGAAEPPPPPPEPVIDEKEIAAREFREFMKVEYVVPLINTALVQADYIILARAGQSALENRPVTKYFYPWVTDWEKEIENPMPHTLWVSGTHGAAGFLDDQGVLNSLNLLSGEKTSTMHLGTKPPFEKIPILGGACDSNLGRLYILNKQWVLEIWDFHEKSSAPIKRVKVLSKIVGYDYVQKYFANPNNSKSPNLIHLGKSGAIIVNSTCADGFIYCFEPISLTLLWRSRLTLDEIKIPKNICNVIEEFELFISECIKKGITEQGLYNLFDINKTSIVSNDDFQQIIKKNNLPVKDSLMKILFKIIDPKSLGFIYLDKLFYGKYLLRQEFVKSDLDQMILLPEWVNNIHANEAVKECMCKISQIMETKSITSAMMIEKLKNTEEIQPESIVNEEEYVSMEAFKKTLEELLKPEISDADFELAVKIADRDNSGKINYIDFMGNISSKKLAPSSLNQLNSQGLPRDSLKYVLHKSIELGIDLYKRCKDLDRSASGTLPKDLFSSMLLMLPMGIDSDTLSIILDRDLTYNSIGHVDYLEIFERQEYYKLLISSKRTDFLTPPVQEEAAVIQDFVYMQELNLIAFATNNPVSSIIHVKDLQGSLVAKLVGHFNNQAPLMHYIQESNCLITAETRRLEPSQPFAPELPPCEILLWNLQQDIINKFKYQPSWIIKPFKKVYAHKGTIRDLAYLPLTQVVASVGSDGLLKLWNPTGVPFTLAEEENLPISLTNGEEISSQYTKSNQIMACVRTVDLPNGEKLKSCVYENVEWLLCITFDKEKNVFAMNSSGFQRFSLCVPAKQHDWEIPEKVQNQVTDVFCKYRAKALDNFNKGIELRVNEILQKRKSEKEYEKGIENSVMKSVIFAENFNKIIQVLEGYPNKKNKSTVSIEEFYNALVKYAGFHSVTYSMFVFLLNDIQEKHFARKITNKSEAEMVSLIRSLQESLVVVSEEVKEEEFDVASLQQKIFTCICKNLQDKGKSAFDMLSKLDSNQDKMLNCDEFLEFLHKIDLNLRKTEASCIMNCLNLQSNTTLKTQELQKKLEDCGYSDPYNTNFYEYLFEDLSVQNFLKKFKKQHKFRNYFEFFSYFDSNNDGFLLPEEVLLGLLSVDRKNAERLYNITITTMKNEIETWRLAEFFEEIEKKQLLLPKVTPNYSAMEICVKKYNSLEELSRSAEELKLITSSIFKEINIGIEIHARKYRLIQGIRHIKSAKMMFQELVDSLLSVCLVSLNKLIPHGSEVKTVKSSEKFNEDEIKIQVYKSGDLQIVWENTQEIREGEGKVISNSIPVMAIGYSSKFLEREAKDQVGLANSLQREIKANIFIQKNCENIAKVLGTFEQTNEEAKETVIVFQKMLGQSINYLISHIGGVLHIPIIKKIKATSLLLSFWGRQILGLLKELHSLGFCANTLSIDNLYISDDGSKILLKLRGIGFIDSDGKITNSIDLVALDSSSNIFLSSFVAPEFFIESVQTSSVDVWSFAVVMLSLMFGEEIKGFFKAYHDWCSNKCITPKLGSENLKPCKSFFYSPVVDFEIKAGKPYRVDHKELNLLKSLQKCSFSGLISDFNTQNDESVEIAQLFRALMQKDEDKAIENNDMGKIFDLLSLCLQVNANKRPNIESLLASSSFALTDAQENQAKSYAKIIFKHKNPELVVSKFITEKLADIEKNFSNSKVEETQNLLQNLTVTLLSCEDNVIKDTINAVNLSDVPAEEKEIMISRNLVFPSTELFNKCIEDKVFLRISRICLEFSVRNEFKILETYTGMLKSILEYINSVKFPLLKHAHAILEAFLVLYTGNLTQNEYDGSILTQSYWAPELFTILSPLYKEFFTENSQRYPVLSKLINFHIHPDYFSELQIILENLSLLKNPESNLFQRINSLKTLENTLVSNNEHKLKAAFDTKFPQFIVSLLQDDEGKIRSEVLDIFYEISKSCREQSTFNPGEVKYNRKGEEIVNYLVVSNNEGRDIGGMKSQSALMAVERMLKNIAGCFENAIFIYPIVRMIKLKSETGENKEQALKLLINCLQGNEKTQQACLSPVTDSLSIICMSLTSFARSLDGKGGRGNENSIQNLFEEFLSRASPFMLKNVRLAPGFDILLKEQDLRIPDTVTLITLLNSIPNNIDIEYDHLSFMYNLKNWMKGVYKKDTPDSIAVLNDVHECINHLQDLINAFWGIVEAQFSKNKVQNISPEQKRQVKAKIRDILEFFEWTIENNFDFNWFNNVDNMEWVVEKSLKSLEHSGSDYEAFPFEEEGILCLRILCRLLNRPTLELLFEKIVYGKVFTTHIKAQYGKMKESMMKNSNPLQILELNRNQSKVRQASFNRLLNHSALRLQLIEHHFCEVLVRDFLADKKQLQLKLNDYVLEFLSFSELFPTRHEAQKMMRKVFKERESCPELFENLIDSMRTHKTIQNELKNIQDSNPVLNTSSIEFLQELIRLAENELSGLLVQAEAAKALKGIFASNPKLRGEFPSLEEYANRLSN